MENIQIKVKIMKLWVGKGIPQEVIKKEQRVRKRGLLTVCSQKPLFSDFVEGE